MLKAGPCLIADLGATHVRFAITHPGATELEQTLLVKCADFISFEAACKHYLNKLPTKIEQGIIAVACPVLSDWIAMTNHEWQFSIKELSKQLGFHHLEAVNDLEAIAIALPHLKQADLISVGNWQHVQLYRPSPSAVIAPGSGLGVSALVPYPSGHQAIATEGGHMTLAPATTEERQILEILEARFGHISAERLISGQGIENLYSAIQQLYSGPLDAPPEKMPTAVEITQMASEPSCRFALKTIAIFSHLLGNVAGNLALVYGALSGVYIAGGIVPRLGDLFDHEKFRHGFENKGRFSSYLKAVPTYLITHPLPALLGLQHHLTALTQPAMILPD